MRDFKFFSTIDEERARLLREFLGDEDAIEPMVPYQSETPQVYTQMFRMEIPLNQLSEDQRNHLKISNENMILNQLSNTLDFRHEVIHQDENGFTLRTELFI